MSVNKEWVCAAHGPFESPEPICPAGCTGRFVEREIRTPVGHISRKTRFSDATHRAIANDFGLTNMSNRDGSSVMSNQIRPPPAEGFDTRWMTHTLPKDQLKIPNRGRDPLGAPPVNFAGLGMKDGPGNALIQDGARTMSHPRTFTHFEGKLHRPKT